MTKTITIITGKVEDDVFGSWEDCSPGTYIGHDKIDSIFNNFYGKNIKFKRGSKRPKASL